MNIEEMVNELFELFDKNGDGLISRGEFIDLAEALLHDKGVRFSSNVFRQFDVNHDNSISKEELIEMIMDLAL